MSTENLLRSYTQAGWSVVSREPVKGDEGKVCVTVRRESTFFEDIGRSCGYVVSAPIVGVTSVALSALTMGCGGCCLLVDGNVLEDRGGVLHVDYDKSQAELTRTVGRDAFYSTPCKVLDETNRDYYNFVQPFQTANVTKTLTMNSEVQELLAGGRIPN